MKFLLEPRIGRDCREAVERVDAHVPAIDHAPEQRALDEYERVRIGERHRLAQLLRLLQTQPALRLDQNAQILVGTGPRLLQMRQHALELLVAHANV